MGTIQEKLDYLKETKSKIRSAIEFKADNDLYSEMFQNNYFGNETFRGLKDYIDKIDRGSINSDGCLIHYDGINNYFPEKGPPRHNESAFLKWHNLMRNGRDGEIQRNAYFDDNSLVLASDGDGLYVPANYNLNANNNQFTIEIFAEITQTTCAMQKILSWKDCIEVWFDDTDGTPKVNASTNWNEPGYPGYTLREFSAFPVEIGKPFYFIIKVGKSKYETEEDIKTNRGIEYATPETDWYKSFQSGGIVESKFNPEASGNFTIGYTGNGTDSTPVGDYAKMKLYSFRLFNHYVDTGNALEYMMRRFGYRDLMFYDGSIFVS